MTNPASVPSWILGASDRPHWDTTAPAEAPEWDGSPNTNVLFVGVGGQGIILASKVFTEALVRAGFDVKMSEIHGMSQRGGSVVTQIRFGQRVFSPLFPKGEADVILAFERLEAVRWLPHLRAEGGTVVINDLSLIPVSVSLGTQRSPDDPIGLVSSLVSHTTAVDAVEIAREAGNSKAANIVLLGVLAARISETAGIDQDTWLAALEAKVPAKHLDVNRTAFLAGYRLGAKPE
jgi:indolepyruvate ferredoxin oxidoreductase beta subunit